MKKLAAVTLIYLMVIALLVFQPAESNSAYAQDVTTPNPYIDALGTQAALNTQATWRPTSNNKTRPLPQTPPLRRKRKLLTLRNRRRIAAGQQQAALAAAQSTSDAAALQATAIVQQTRTAIEISAQQTREASDARATATAQALQAKATQAAIEATRVSADAQRRDNESISTVVAMSIEATKVAIDRQTQIESDRAATVRRTNAIGSLVAHRCVIIIVGLLIVLLIGKFGSRFVAITRAQSHADAVITSLSATPSAASNAVVDAATDEIGSRFAIIEHNDDPAALADLLRSIYGR